MQMLTYSIIIIIIIIFFLDKKALVPEFPNNLLICFVVCFVGRRKVRRSVLRIVCWGVRGSNFQAI